MDGNRYREHVMLIMWLFILKICLYAVVDGQWTLLSAPVVLLTSDDVPSMFLFTNW